MHQAKNVKLHDLGPNTEKSIVSSLQVKVPLEKCRPRWEDNIKTELIKVGCKFVDLIFVTQDRDHRSHVIICSARLDFFCNRSAQAVFYSEATLEFLQKQTSHISERTQPGLKRPPFAEIPCDFPQKKCQDKFSSNDIDHRHPPRAKDSRDFPQIELEL
jgi:hypothetical protein